MATFPFLTTVTLRPATLCGWLLAGWGLLVSLAAVTYLTGSSGQPRPLLANWYHFTTDRSLLRLYAAGLLWALGAVAALAGSCAPARSRPRLTALALCGLVLGVEQIALLQAGVRNTLTPALGGLARLVAVVPAGMLLAVLVGWGARALPRPLRRWVLACAALYLSGAVGLAALAGLVANAGLGPWLVVICLWLGQAVETLALLFLMWRVLLSAATAAATPAGYAFGVAPHAGQWVLRPLLLLRGLLVLIGVLALASLLSFWAAPALEGQLAASLVRRFNFDDERSFYTALSGALLLAAVLLLALIAALQRARRDAWWRMWALLALVFAYLTVDELASLHEVAGALLPPSVEFFGPQVFRWVLLAVPLLIILALLYTRFLLRLPPRTRLLFVLAASFYIGGALGVELLGAYVIERAGSATFLYRIVSTVEETLEGFGLAVLLFALLDYLGAHWGTVRLVLTPD